MVFVRPIFCRLVARMKRNVTSRGCMVRVAVGLWLALSFSVTGARAEAPELIPLRLQLKWSHQFQFAGFYAAVEKGFYRDAGLEVTLVEGRAGVDFIHEVISGAADFGIEMPDLLLRRAKGDPVVVLAAIYQHSPYVIVSLEEAKIASPHDLIGRSVMLRPSSNAEIRAMLLNEGVPLDGVRFVDHAFNAGALSGRSVDAMSMYTSTIAHEPTLQDAAISILHPINYGVDFYGDCLFTSESLIAERPDDVRAFRSASLRGWDYAMEHPEEMATLIHERYAPTKPVADLLAEARRMEPLLLHKFVEPGHMNPGRWRHIADTFAKVGLLPPAVSLEGFLYDPHVASDALWLKWTAGVALTALVLMGGTALTLLLFNRRLDRAVHERTTELRRVNLALEAEVIEREAAEEKRRNLERQVWHAQKLESLGVLAGGIAHDFNNLLTVILGSADVAMQIIEPDAPARPLVDEIRNASNRAADLTRQMLAYSGRGHFEIREVNLNELVGEIARLLSASVAKHVTITMRLAGELPAVRADSAQLQQIVMNLITNAAEAIPEDQAGEVVLSTEVVHCSNHDLDMSRLPEKPTEGDFVCLQVSDNGCGMDTDALNRLFEPFYTTKSTGRGLGMSATLGIVRGHIGAITVDSSPGIGTTIRVLLPAADKSVQNVGSDCGGGRGGGGEWRGHGTVLLVDDEEAVRTLAARMLERMGFKVLTAADGVEGVALFRAHADEVRCILLDFSMPRMDGVQASLELHRVKAGVPIVVCSGFNRQEVEHRFQDSPIAAFLHKPFRYEEVRQAFRVALGEG